jgi:hypothetical protein
MSDLHSAKRPWEWDWDREDVRASTVFPSVRAVAVYLNEDGDVVIRQASHGHGDDEQVVVVPVAFVGQLVQALTDRAEESGAS